MKNFRIVKKFYKFGEFHEIKCHFVIEYLGKKFDFSRLGFIPTWMEYKEKVYSPEGWSRDVISFSKIEDAERFVNNLIAELPASRVAILYLAQ